MESRSQVNLGCPRVFVAESHDEAYRTWLGAGVNSRTLVHIDAHHDMWWAEDGQPITIANFICPALRNNLVGEVYWVVPDMTWKSARGRRAVLQHLRRIKKAYPGVHSAIRTKKNEICASIGGKSLRVWPLRSLPRLTGTVLLDIDVDFLVISSVTFWEAEQYGTLPWCWPDELLKELESRNICADIATIAYSVNGGFTPLKWKYLGDELALRLSQHSRHSAPLDGMLHMREAAIASSRGDFVRAERKYHQAAKLLPASAAPHYHLALLYLEMGRAPDAKEFYRRAVALDPSYRTPYNNAGPEYHSQHRFVEAEREYLRTLALDPDDAYAHLGLGRLAARRKLWAEAENLISKALALNGQLTDAYRVLGDVLVKQGRRDEAVRAYERSLKLALTGHKTLGEPITTFLDQGGVWDPKHRDVHAHVARLYELKGAAHEAISGYRMSIGGGHDGFLVRSRLARLYASQQQWKRALQEARQCLKIIPADLNRVIRLRYRRLRIARARSKGRHAWALPNAARNSLKRSSLLVARPISANLSPLGMRSVSSRRSRLPEGQHHE